MANIILKDYEGNEQIYEGVEKVKLNTTDGGTQLFSRGDTVENVPITLDFRNGNQTVNAPNGYLVKSAIIVKPENLKSEYIAKDVEIAGIVGTNEGRGDAQVIKYVTFMYGETELIKYPVIVGDTCRDVVTLGIIDAPTKEPTVSTVYSFGGWSLTDDGTVDSDALTNVTEDRTVYLVFKGETRKYTVNFYDGETLVHTEQVGYGGSSDYKYTKDGYAFNGWTPKPIGITGNMDCYAQWSEKPTFANASWAEIDEISESGKASEIFAIGDTRYATINGVSTQIEIIGFNHDDKADGSGKAGITVWATVLSSIISTYSGYSSTGYSWLSTSAYNSGIKNVTFEDELAAVVKTVNKTYEHIKNGSLTYPTIATNVWMISLSELGFEITSTPGAEGTVYEKFSGGKTSTSSTYTDIALANAYWTRSFKGNVSVFNPVGVRTTGKLLLSPGTSERYYPSICFCI